jgi:hypothetical protein
MATKKKKRGKSMDGIEQHEGGGVTFTGNGMYLLRLTTMLRCLGMEIKGIRMVRHSVYAQAKREFGFKGNKQKVYDQLAEYVKKTLESEKANDSDVDALIRGSGPGF